MSIDVVKGTVATLSVPGWGLLRLSFFLLKYTAPMTAPTTQPIRITISNSVKGAIEPPIIGGLGGGGFLTIVMDKVVVLIAPSLSWTVSVKLWTPTSQNA